MLNAEIMTQYGLWWHGNGGCTFTAEGSLASSCASCLRLSLRRILPIAIGCESEAPTP